MFQFIWFYWNNFHLLHLVWKLVDLQAQIYKSSELKRKMEKCEIFRFIANFSSTVNNPIHKILPKKFPIFRNWKNVHHLHSGWNLADFYARVNQIWKWTWMWRWRLRRRRRPSVQKPDPLQGYCASSAYQARSACIKKGFEADILGPGHKTV